MKIIASLLSTGLLLAGAPEEILADQHGESSMNASGIGSWIDAHAGAEYSGPAELWIDPMGNNTLTSDATLQVVDGGIDYTWSYEGEAQRGQLRIEDGTLRWQDSWHQGDGVDLEIVHGQGSLVAAEYSYPAGSGPDWHWRIKLAERPDDTLVLQMTNIAPWGEEARAVRMVLAGSDPEPDE